MKSHCLNNEASMGKGKQECPEIESPYGNDPVLECDVTVWSRPWLEMKDPKNALRTSVGCLKFKSYFHLPLDKKEV